MPRPRKPSPATHRFNLVIPDELWRRLQVVAARNRRSATQQILYAIDWTTRTEKENESEPAKFA